VYEFSLNLESSGMPLGIGLSFAQVAGALLIN